LKGFTQEEASEKIHTMIKERHRTIRAEGLKKIIFGSLIALGSAGSLLGMWKVGFFSPFVFGGVGLACVGGLWMLLNGLFKFLSPGSQGGDASEND
jgi:predicted phage tail protein